VSADDRLDRLEQRVAVLETLMRELAGRAPAAPPAPVSPPLVQAPRPAAAAAAPATPVPLSPAPATPVAPPPPSISSGAPAGRPAGRPGSRLTSEQWIGQRGLLAIGVAALITAMGYLLKLSFDRNWITPVMRCVGGVGAGLIVGGIGWRLQPRYRTYGAALIGCGAGIIYLSVWAAARLYGVVPSFIGIVALALVSIALAMIAYAINVEALGATAALGAFLAPVLLGHDQSNANLLLLYLTSMAAGLGLVAARRGWRLTMLVVAASYFGVGSAGAADRAAPWGVLLFGMIGGTAGLYVGLRERWWETRFLTFSGGWWLVAAASDRLHQHWPVLVAALVLAAPVWWHGLRRPRVLPLDLAPQSTGPGWSAGEALYFFITPLLLSWAIHTVAPGRFHEHPGLVPLLVGLPYLLVGYGRPLPAFATVGAAALGIAAAARWDGTSRVWVLLGLSLLWPALDHRLDRTDGRWYGTVTLAFALEYLFHGALDRRTAADAAFVGPWALALWGAVISTMALAAGIWRGDPAREETRLARNAFWVVAGLMALFGVTAEIRRFFTLRSVSVENATLAAGLAVSAWWLVFAAALVGLGFLRALKPVRVAGLTVAGLAVIKVVFFDLSSLDALYRIGSVFLLGFVMLSLAYLYYRHDRTAGTS
jgi:uncharacterized membrane protein